MPRLEIPEDFVPQSALITSIIAKNTADGASSEIKGYLTNNGIVLANLPPIQISAKAHLDDYDKNFKKSTNYTQLRDNHAKLPLKYLRSGAQNLKTLNASNPKELTNWSLTITDTGKIDYPTNFSELANVAIGFYNKHLSYAAGTSPLQPFVDKNNIDVAAMKASLLQAITENDNADSALRIAQNSLQQFNLLWMPVVDIARGIGNYLITLYPDNPKALGAYGFKVVTATKKPKLTNSILQLGMVRTYKGVIIGTVLTCLGPGEVNVYKGDSNTGMPTVLKEGEKMGIQKGWSTLTVENLSNLASVKISLVRSK